MLGKIQKEFRNFLIAADMAEGGFGITSADLGLGYDLP
jgi:hypothetical protein